MNLGFDLVSSIFFSKKKSWKLHVFLNSLCNGCRLLLSQSFHNFMALTTPPLYLHHHTTFLPTCGSSSFTSTLA
jgi:hypothetical protein